MAIPTIAAIGARVANVPPSTPTMPAGVRKGDLLLLFCETENQAITVNGGTEVWTEIPGTPGVGIGGDVDAVRLTVFWARASQNSPTSPSTNAAGDHQLVQIIAVRGALQQGNPIDVIAVATEAGNTDTSGVIPGATTTLPDCLVFAVTALARPSALDFNSQNVSAWANADLSNFAEIADSGTLAGSAGALGIATGGKAAYGAYGTTTFTTVTTTAKAMMTFAVRAEETAFKRGPTYMQQIVQGVPRALMFFMVDSLDHVTGKTGLAPTVLISKNGATFDPPAGVVSEIGRGWYKLAATAQDVGALGTLILSATANGAHPSEAAYEVIAEDPAAVVTIAEQIKAKTDKIGTVSMNAVYPAISPAGHFMIHKGFDYDAAHGQAIDVTVSGLSLAGATVDLYDPADEVEVSGEVDGQAVRFEFTKEATAELRVGSREWVMRATYGEALVRVGSIIVRVME